MTTNNSCCAECGKDGGVSLKACKACMSVKYCNADCQRKHWAKHKAACKLRAAELRDEALFKDPPPKEDCPICFLPMPNKLVSCVSLPPATISSLPIHNYADANEALVGIDMETYFPCCGKSVCKGCVHSFNQTGNDDKCPFCNAGIGKTREENVEEIMKRAEANDPASIYVLASFYYHGDEVLQQDRTKSMELYARAAELGCSKAHYQLGGLYHEGGNLKKAKFHWEAAAMAGHEVARCNLGNREAQSGNMERAVKHWTIGATAGDYIAMHNLLIALKKHDISRESMDSTLTAYNNACAEMRSKDRDTAIQLETDTI
jgi:hypothetical protein